MKNKIILLADIEGTIIDIRPLRTYIAKMYKIGTQKVKKNYFFYDIQNQEIQRQYNTNWQKKVRPFPKELLKVLNIFDVHYYFTGMNESMREVVEKIFIKYSIPFKSIFLFKKTLSDSSHSDLVEWKESIVKKIRQKYGEAFIIGASDLPFEIEIFLEQNIDMILAVKNDWVRKTQLSRADIIIKNWDNSLIRKLKSIIKSQMSNSTT